MLVARMLGGGTAETSGDLIGKRIGDAAEAASSGERPPTPAYSPPEFSRAITQSSSPPLTWRNGEMMPGSTRVGRTSEARLLDGTGTEEGG